MARISIGRFSIILLLILSLLVLQQFKMAAKIHASRGQGHFQVGGPIFETTEAHESHRRQTGASNVASSATGEGSTSSHSNSSNNFCQNQPCPNKNHDKYFYLDFVPDVTDYFENYGDIMNIYEEIVYFGLIKLSNFGTVTFLKTIYQSRKLNARKLFRKS